MRIFLLSAVFCVCFSISAYADGRAFPPDHCSPGAPFMAFSGIDGSNTFCDSGQDILSSALLPGCGANQQVVYDGSKFICKDEPNVPTCPDGQVLTFLTGSGFTCVNSNAKVPNCTANQFLTYSGGAFQCANVQNLTIPTCGPSQVLTASNGQLVCTDTSSNVASGTVAGYCISFDSYDWPGTDWAPITAPMQVQWTSASTTGARCVCPDGWTHQVTGTCDFGQCAIYGNEYSHGGAIVYSSCVKN